MSPRNREQNEEIRSQRVQEILQAAVKVYVDKGYAASEIGEVAERAGMARGLVYYYFKDKKSLFRELVRSMMDLSAQFTKQHFEQHKDVTDLFAKYALYMCKRVLEDPTVPRFYMRIPMDIAHVFKEEEFSPFQWVKVFMQPMAQAIEKGQREGAFRKGDAQLMASQFWGSISHGMSYLDSLQQEMVAQGMDEEQRTKRLTAVLEQAVESSMSALRGEETK